MSNLSHFAINADDVDATRRFYEAVLGWQFTAWGPPGFYQIRTGTEEDPGVRGAIQQRRELVPGRTPAGLECTFAVDDVAAVGETVVASGGRVVMDRMVISGVGELIFFEDPSGNIVGAMHYDSEAE